MFTVYIVIVTERYTIKFYCNVKKAIFALTLAFPSLHSFSLFNEGWLVGNSTFMMRSENNAIKNLEEILN